MPGDRRKPPSTQSSNPSDLVCESLTILSKAEGPRSHSTGLNDNGVSKDLRASLVDCGSNHGRLLLPASSRKSYQEGSRDPLPVQKHELAEVLVVRDEHAPTLPREGDHFVIPGVELAEQTPPPRSGNARLAGRGRASEPDRAVRRGGAQSAGQKHGAWVFWNSMVSFKWLPNPRARNGTRLDLSRAPRDLQWGSA